MPTTIQLSQSTIDAIQAALNGPTSGNATYAAARQDDPAAHSLAPQAKPMSDLVFAAKLTPRSSTMKVDGRTATLAAGMTVSVEIKTGKRRILSYPFSPLVDVTSNALGER
jgi:hemolysin D